MRAPGGVDSFAAVAVAVVPSPFLLQILALPFSTAPAKLFCFCQNRSVDVKTVERKSISVCLSFDNDGVTLLKQCTSPNAPAIDPPAPFIRSPSTHRFCASCDRWQGCTFRRDAGAKTLFLRESKTRRRAPFREEPLLRHVYRLEDEKKRPHSLLYRRVKAGPLFLMAGCGKWNTR